MVELCTIADPATVLTGLVAALVAHTIDSSDAVRDWKYGRAHRRDYGAAFDIRIAARSFRACPSCLQDSILSAPFGTIEMQLGKLEFPRIRSDSTDLQWLF